MRCVILAAGDGSRLAPLTLQHPKPLLHVLGRPLIDYTLETLVAVGICDLILVVGYQQEQIRDWVGDGHRYGARVNYVPNPNFELENAQSLYAARHAVADLPFMLTMADHMISKDIVHMLLTRRLQTDTLCVDRRASSAPQLSDATRVWVNSHGHIRQIGKGLAHWNAVDTGVFLFTSAVFDAMDALRAQGKFNLNLSQSVTWLIERGNGLQACDVSGAWWTDVDTLEDLQNVEAELNRR